MTSEEAHRLAVRILDTWPIGTRAYVWRDNLLDLDHGTAWLAYRRLERGSDRAPTPAQFHALYRDLLAESRVPEEPPPHCPDCQGSGWIEGPPNVVRLNGEDHPSATVQPCACASGERMRPLFERIRSSAP